MLNTTENTPIAGATLADLERQALVFSTHHRDLCTCVDEMQTELAAIRDKHLRRLRAAVARATTSRDTLKSTVELNPSLFTKPRTRTIHGIKVGFAKGKGKLEIPNEVVTIKKIIAKFGLDGSEPYLIKTVKPNKKSLDGLTAAELKSLGINSLAAGDRVVVNPADSEVDKLVAALLKGSDEEEAA